MDKIADFYDRWFRVQDAPDYPGAAAACETLAKEVLGVYKSGKRDFWQSCAVYFLRGTILHLACKAYLEGGRRIDLAEVIGFLETTQREKNWNELRESQGGDENVRQMVAGVGEFMLENPAAAQNRLVQKKKATGCQRRATVLALYPCLLGRQGHPRRYLEAARRHSSGIVITGEIKEFQDVFNQFGASAISHAGSRTLDLRRIETCVRSSFARSLTGSRNE
ncbi:MAG: hypothetical protein JO170_10065 [Verrucomicrobia bacterium]|nr:hypothetical protein [Verrucomicrobiota bacterium]